MFTIQQLKDAILAEAEKHSNRFHHYHNYLELWHGREVKRVNNPQPKEIRLPEYWNHDRKFNPFFVDKHAKAIAIAIQKKLERGIYTPNPPYIKEIQKPAGGTRRISIFQIPDAAVSNLMYRHLLRKNKHRFSAFSYAYRNDRNAHFAVQDIAVDLKRYSRLFVCECDFSDFFGSIDHGYLRAQFTRNGFAISDRDIQVIEGFLRLSKKGVPQGTAISLFLANLACWELDKEFEQHGVKFARYADDTVIWTSEYPKICKAYDCLHAFSQNAGIKINFKKSEGISLLAQEGLAGEFVKTKRHVEFLGYKLSVATVGIKSKSVRRIQKHISYIVYKNLIEPLRGQLRAVTIPSNNHDPGFLTTILQIRRYLYGGLSERQLKIFLKGKVRRLAFKGVMSFYPLLEDEAQLKALDGWLIGVLHRSLKLRSKLLIQHNFDRSTQFPFNQTKDELIARCRTERVGRRRALQIPSFLRIYQAIKRGVVSQGLEQTVQPRISNSSDEK